MIDNYDSFTYNLVQYFSELGEEVSVFRNDKIDLLKIREINPKRICISPGPCTPDLAGISCDCIREFAGKIPILGVCLGHQAIAQVFEAEVVGADRLMHGKTSEIFHHGDGIFASLPSPFVATRYHSLIVKKSSLPSCLKITAFTSDDEVMGIQHKDFPLYGVQFHPESILTETGKDLLANFLNMPII